MENNNRPLKDISTKEIIKKSNNHDVEAINELAYRYFYGKGIKKNQEKAFKLYTESYSYGSIKAEYNVGVSLLFGEGTLKDEEKAFQIFEDLEKKKHINSILRLGDIYHFGFGKAIDYKKSAYYYSQAYNLDPNNLSANYSLANAYYSGRGVEENIQKAYSLYSKLVNEFNYEKAYCPLGIFYYFGKIVPQDYQKALFYFTKSIEYNCNVNVSKYFLGTMYLLGKGVTIDYKKAKKYFKDSLFEESDESYYKLGLMYSNGYGMKKNEQKANKFFNKIEIDLCIALMFYLIATDDDYYTNSLKKIYDFLNLDTSYLKQMLQLLPPSHPSRLYSERVLYLDTEDYCDIVERLKQKVTRVAKNEKFESLIKHFDHNEDVIFFATCLVESYEYDSITEYIKYQLNKKDDMTLIFIGKLYINGFIVEKDILKGFEYLLISNLQSPNISEGNRLIYINRIIIGESKYVSDIPYNIDPKIRKLLKKYKKSPYIFSKNLIN